MIAAFASTSSSLFVINNNATAILLFSTIVVGILYILYAFSVFTIWGEYFSGKRLTRCCKESPSNRQPPAVKTWQHNKEKILRNSRKHDHFFDACGLVHDLANHLDATKRDNNEILRKKAQRTPSLKPGKAHQESLQDSLAEKLDMDHIYVDFFNFLWAYTFIAPCSYLLWKSGVTWLLIRQFLVKHGILKVKPFDIDVVIGKLCLEQTQAIHYYAKTKKGSKLGSVAGFIFADFAYIDQDSKYRVADLFSVDIDLATKKFVEAKLDNTNLTASDALILLWFNTITTQHVKLHSLANWGVNLDEAVKETNPFLHRNSIVTTMYNYFGYTCFRTYTEGWEKQGLLAAGFDENALMDCFDHGINENIWQHSNIADLARHSNFVRFVVKVRKIFLNEFAKHKDVFPGVDGEAMFVGTVLHSLDHAFMEWNLEDPLWLDVCNPRFGIMAQIGRIVRVGFVKDVPLLYFHKRFKGSGHPFYETVHKKAARVDKKLADNMDTCIIK